MKEIVYLQQKDFVMVTNCENTDNGASDSYGTLVPWYDANEWWM